jgi:2-polyprenyl-3-methyl-5-hydroxy-6-metoxy-1,4-benzoquinol methylase
MARMSTLERWLIKSPFRAWLQRGESRAFARWAALFPGATVLDMGCASGPYCGKLLADLGAEVIKVEQPPAGAWPATTTNSAFTSQ